MIACWSIVCPFSCFVLFPAMISINIYSLFLMLTAQHVQCRGTIQQCTCNPHAYSVCNFFLFWSAYILLYDLHEDSLSLYDYHVYSFFRCVKASLKVVTKSFLMVGVVASWLGSFQGWGGFHSSCLLGMTWTIWCHIFPERYDQKPSYGRCWGCLGQADAKVDLFGHGRSLLGPNFFDPKRRHLASFAGFSFYDEHACFSFGDLHVR